MRAEDHHEVKVYYDGEPVAVASGPKPCAELMGNLLTEMFCKGLATRAGISGGSTQRTSAVKAGTTTVG